MELYKRYVKEDTSKKTKKRKEECLDKKSFREVTSVSEDRCITLEPCVITPNSSLRNVFDGIEDAPPPVLGNDLRGFEYLPATKFRRDV